MELGSSGDFGEGRHFSQWELTCAKVRRCEQNGFVACFKYACVRLTILQCHLRRQPACQEDHRFWPGGVRRSRLRSLSPFFPPSPFRAPWAAKEWMKSGTSTALPGSVSWLCDLRTCSRGQKEKGPISQRWLPMNQASRPIAAPSSTFINDKCQGLVDRHGILPPWTGLPKGQR